MLDKLKEENIPIRMTHFLCNVFIYNFNFHFNLSTILQIASKIEYKKLGTLINILEDKFDDAIEKNEIYNVGLFLEHFPNISKTRQGSIFSFMKKIISKYQNCKSIPNEDIYLISSLFNVLAPRRKEFNSNQLSDSRMYEPCSSIHKQRNILRPIPDYFVQNSPFWKFISDNYELLGRIYEQIGSSLIFYQKFEFLLDYPEIVDFNTRSTYFHKHIEKKYLHLERSEVHYIKIDRSNIIQSSRSQLETPKNSYYTYKTNVRFIGENGVDLGGLFRDWITTLIKELLNPKNKLFELTENECLYPSRNCEDYSLMNFAGKMIAYCLLNNVCVDAHLAPFFLKKILHHEIKFNDVKSYSQSNYDSYIYMMNNDVDDLDLTFVAGFNDGSDQYKEVELISNGSKIKVTNENKKDYINKIYSFYLIDSIENQSNEFCKGLDSIVPHNYLRIFSPGELELLICGLPEIDIEDMKKNIILYNYTLNSPTIQCFFSAISKWDNEQLASLLQFITGNSKVPLEGFVNKKISIYKGGDVKSLPQGRTCSKALILPDYQNEEVINKKLLQEISECDTFGFP